MTKYNKTDKKTVLEASDDAAVANWGGSWRMPTKADFQTLGAVVNTAWTQVNNVYGILYIDKEDSSKTLFFPAAGNCSYGNVSSVGYVGSYWSSSLDSGKEAFSLSFNSRNVDWGNLITTRFFGCAVRPVVG